jgi:translation initiation factor IF-3
MSVIATTQQRINREIRAREVRVIDNEGNQLGVLSLNDAIQAAWDRDLDLVEVAATSRPPVCRIMDYGKFKYEQNRRARKAKKKQHQMQLKEVKMRPKVEKHDYDFKIVHAREFLADRDKVKLTVTFRGREIAHTDLGRKLLLRFAKDLAVHGLMDGQPRLEGRNAHVMISPVKTDKAKPKEEEESNKKHHNEIPQIDRFKSYHT